MRTFLQRKLACLLQTMCFQLRAKFGIGQYLVYFFAYAVRG